MDYEMFLLSFGGKTISGMQMLFFYGEESLDAHRGPLHGMRIQLNLMDLANSLVYEILNGKKPRA